MKEVNLEEILKSYLTVETITANNPDYTFNMVISAMREACRQVLELGAKNARVKYYYTGDGNEVDYAEVKSDSITNTINQVK